MDLSQSTIPQLKKLIKDQGIAMPMHGTGKNRAVLKKDLINAILAAGQLPGKMVLEKSPKTPGRSDIGRELSFNERYEIVRTLGTGGYGVVYLARSKKNGSLVAVKELSLAHKNVAQREYEVTKNIPCTMHVVCYRDFFISDHKVYLVMDYLEGVELFEMINDRADAGKPFSIQELLIMFKQLLIGLNTLHDHNVAHMDIKIENVMMTVGGPVIIDLGMTCSLISTPKCDLQYSRGTEETWSPELAYAQSTNYPTMSSAEFFATDIWNLGLVFKAMADFDTNAVKIPSLLAGGAVRKNRETYLVEWSYINGTRPAGSTCDGLNKLVDSMLKIDYRERPTAKQLLDNIDRIKC